MRLAMVTLFPEIFAALSGFGITGRAIREGLVQLSCFNPRDFTQDRHRTVDDKPYGGGPGMLMKTGPLESAIRMARDSLRSQGGKVYTLYLSPQGRTLDHTGVTELAGRENLVLVCGRYQGIDQRLLDTEIDEEWSVGDYVLSGGELAAMVLADTVIRQLPGALGDEGSAGQDSFSSGLLHWPEYTRPQRFGSRDVPEVLVNGNHEQIRRWRLKYSLGATWQKRPDLLAGRELDKEQQDLLQEYIEEFKSNAQLTDQ